VLTRPNDSDVIVCFNCAARQAPSFGAASARRRAEFVSNGYDIPTCALCGLDEIGLLQLHHLAGDANDELQAPLCLNCHTEQSDLQEDYVGIDLRRRDPERTRRLRLAALLEGLANFFSVLIQTLRSYAAWCREPESK
jgi:hypothetical protein